MNNENNAVLDKYVEAVERRLDEIRAHYGTVSGDHQHEVTEAMWYSLSAGGKRIRPVLAMEFCRICGGSPEAALSAAAAVEMIHTFSLIHDDLPCMDNDDLRRGKPSCHRAFREDTALLAGDALENLAFNVLADDDNIPPEGRLALIRELSSAVGIKGMIGGQVIDMYNVNGAVFPDDKLLMMYSMKTSALLKAACRMGCICAGAYDKLEAAEEYAENMGLAFQIIDDVLDIIGDEKTLGKPIGSDALAGKCTYASVHGAEASLEYAAQLTERAERALDNFGDSGFLRELTHMLLHRKM